MFVFLQEAFVTYLYRIRNPESDGMRTNPKMFYLYFGAHARAPETRTVVAFVPRHGAGAGAAPSPRVALMPSPRDPARRRARRARSAVPANRDEPSYNIPTRVVRTSIALQ